MQRIFIASTLNEYDEVIYLDPDILVLRDVDPLLNYPLRNKFLAVYDPDFINVRVFGTCDIPYFNNGVFITSLSYWRDHDIEGQMVRWLLEHGPTECIEQDLMNRFLIDVWSPLPMSFNSSPFSTARNDYTLTTPLIFHFVGPSKPWHQKRTTLKHEGAWRKVLNSIKENK
jgi:lipopolysaccharide biosynthesis glycosyltransferase